MSLMQIGYLGYSRKTLRGIALMVLIGLVTACSNAIEEVSAPKNIAIDKPGEIFVNLLSSSTSEAGDMASFTVELLSQPSAAVIIGVSSSDSNEGTVNQAEITFDASNWNKPQSIIIMGVDDNIADGDQSYSILLTAATSTDENYNGLDPADVIINNLDDDVVGINVGALSGNTTELGGTASFNVVLTSQPMAEVSVDLSSTDNSEGVVNTSAITFTSDSWNRSQTITVTGINDDKADGNQPYIVQLAPATSNDELYNGLDPIDVSVTNIDDDSPGYNISPISGNTTEAGRSAIFAISLTTQPQADVSIDISSTDSTEGIVSPTTVNFTSTSWKIAQDITVTGVDDMIDDGDQNYNILLDPATSTDIDYNGLDPANVTVTNVDNDTAGINVGVISGNTTETGGIATFTVVLNSQPTAKVTIGLSSTDLTEGTVSASSVVFTAVNWNLAQTFTVTGVNDNIADGDQNYNIVLAPASSPDKNYNGADPADVSVINIDDESLSTPVLSLSFSMKQLQFRWPAVINATYYQLMENPNGASGFTQLGADIVGTSVNIDIAVYRQNWANARYLLQACNTNVNCNPSNEVNTVVGDTLSAIGYIKAPNSGAFQNFGGSVSLSSDGSTLAVGAHATNNAAGAVYVYIRDAQGAWINTPANIKAPNAVANDYFGNSVSLNSNGNSLAVGAYGEDSAAIGINGNQTDDCSATTQTNCASLSGAVYVYSRDALGAWSNTPVYIKASNTGESDFFGRSVSFSGDGNTLAIGAYGENSAATGVNGNQTDDCSAATQANCANLSGAVYVYSRDALGVWGNTPVYIKASSTEATILFGQSVNLNGDGNTLAVGAKWENSAATGINGNQIDDCGGTGSVNCASLSGAVYVYSRDALGAWSNTPVYIKASNTGKFDSFGASVSLSIDGNILAVGANGEDSAASGVNGIQIDDCATTQTNCSSDSGAVYIYSRDPLGVWNDVPVYIKASNTGEGDYFGYSISLSSNGNTIAVGAWREDSAAISINGAQNEDCVVLNNCASDSGASYIYERDLLGVWGNTPVYIKASNTDIEDGFGMSVSLSGDGNTLAVGSVLEDSAATAINGNQVDDCGTFPNNNCASSSGAVYLY